MERGTEGFERSKPIAKIGMHAQDTAELFLMTAVYRLLTYWGRKDMALLSGAKAATGEIGSCHDQSSGS